MRGRIRPGLVVKFNILTIAIILATSIGIVSFGVYQESAENYRDLLRNGAAEGSIAAQNSEYGIYTRDSEALDQILGNIGKDDNIVYAAILDSKRAILKEHVYKASIDPLSIIPDRRDLTPGCSELTGRRDRKQYVVFYTPVTSVIKPDVGISPEASAGLGTAKRSDMF